MKFIRLFFLLSLALGFVAAQAQVSSEPVEAPKFVGGENWEYRTTPKSFNDCNPNRPYNTKVSIESIDESGIIAKNGRLTVKMNLGLDEIQDVDGVSNIRRTFNFPMVPGKKWEQRMMDNISSGVLQTDLSCEHGKFEKVTVPAGEFDAVHIVCKGRWNNLTARTSNTATYSYWYSPTVKNIVKREVLTYHRGNICADTETVLLKYQESK